MDNQINIDNETIKRSIGALMLAGDYGAITETEQGRQDDSNVMFRVTTTRKGVPSLKEAFAAFEGLPEDHPLKQEFDPAKAKRLYNGLGDNAAASVNYMGLVASLPL